MPATNTTNQPVPIFLEKPKTLIDVLVEQGTFDVKTGDGLKLQVIQTGQDQEKLLLSKNLVTELALTQAKAKLYDVPFVDLDKIPVSPEAMAKLPQQVATRFKAIPISVDPSIKELTIAMANPMDLNAIEFIEQRTGFRIKPCAAEPSRVELLLSTTYASSLAEEVTEALKEFPSEGAKGTGQLAVPKSGVIREEKVAEIVTHILSFAIKARASDVHIEPQERATRIRYRIDGILAEKLTTPRELHGAIVSRIKILSGMKIDEKRVPQDGRFNFKAEDQEVDLRVSSLPTSWGEKIVMRILKKSGGIPELSELGLRGRALKNIQSAIRTPHGIILICGPTGSGKTTTLYSIIQTINTPKVNIVTLEDPVEYKIAGVNQVQINTGAGLTFASGLRSFLRQDPNIILVGEIRDEETANLAIQASLTGHLVFSTLHTNDSSGALPRLLDMGAEPYLLASSMTAIVAQRVVRKIHQDCKIQYQPEPGIKAEMTNVLGPLWPKNKEMVLYKGKGCAVCNNSGYYGRVGIFEALPITEKISRLMIERSSAADIHKQAVNEGMIAMKQDGYLKALDGSTTIEEVLRVAQE